MLINIPGAVYLVPSKSVCLLAACAGWMRPGEGGGCQDGPQLSAAVMEVESDVSAAAASAGVSSLLVSIESSCMESAASWTDLISSENRRVTSGYNQPSPQYAAI